MPDDFLIARNPEEGSSLPYLLRVPLGEGVVLKARDTWPRTQKIYCHRAAGWPPDAEVVERVPVRRCERRGAAIDLVLDRGRENRSQLVMTRARGREMIFWQTARTAKQARPAVRVPTARGAGRDDLEIVVDTYERYPYRFADQQATTRRAALPAGDYGVEAEGRLVAAVERKGLQDLVASLTTGKLGYQLADLAAVGRAAVVVEERYSQVFRLEHVRPAVVLEGLAECQVRWPSVPVIFTETRKLAQEWTYRFLAAALAADGEDAHGERVLDTLPGAGELAPAPPRPAEVRTWAREHGYAVSDRGRVPGDVRAAYEWAHR